MGSWEMMSGKEYLEIVKTKIEKQRRDTEKALEEGRKDVESMHEYYWENYTEMDQYGYENYDNQQALLRQTNANEQQIKKLQRLTKLLDSPFFGRVDFLYDGEDESEAFYIGIGNFSERTGEVPLIYDWRAPVSSLFYDFDKGPASYEAPGGLQTGEMTGRYQYKIRRGKMVYAFESDTKIDDEILKQELGQSGDAQLKNIVRTIQKEQNAIIRNRKDRILVIQGSAGSGKTSVALHRIAYLLYHDRDRLKASNILILSPNSVFADYISHILPELGEENIKEMSFDLFAYRELKGTAPDCEDRYDHLERAMRFPDEVWMERYREKQGKGFVGQIEGFLAVMEDELMDFSPIEFKGLRRSEEELIQLFYFKFQNIPLLARMDAIREYFVDEYETLHGRDLTEEELEHVQQKFDRQYVTKDLWKIYGWLMESCGYPGLPDVPLEKRKVEYEDVFPMLYLKYRLLGKKEHRGIRHLIIDEMQDYSYMQYVILSMLFDCPMTILGDKEQTMEEASRDVTVFLPSLFREKTRKIVLNKGYRNTLEIASYAEKIKGTGQEEFLARHGRPVEEQEFADVDSLLDAVEERLKLQGEQYETAAVLTRTLEEAQTIYALLKRRRPDIAWIDKDSSVFCKGLSVTTFYLAKGLEFDQVFTVTGKKKNPLAAQADYICATRALHELYVFRTRDPLL